jgi:hypothetical protein
MMNREELFYLAPYLFSRLLSPGVFFYAWRPFDPKVVDVFLGLLNEGKI